MKQQRELSRRKVLAGAAATGAAAALPTFSWALGPHGAPVLAARQEEAWSPLVLSGEQAEVVAALCETILPSTDTPGAREARVHEYIDLSLSVDDEEKESFLEGLESLDNLCKELHGHGLADASVDHLREVLAAVSDENDPLPAERQRGGEFFAQLKGLTIFAYYTSEIGQVDELGLPDYTTMEKWQGCAHRDGGHG